MKLKKVLSVVLAGSLLLSCTGCNGFRSRAKKYADAIDDLGFEKYLENDFRDVDEDDIEDGVYCFATNPKNIKKFVKKVDFADVDADDVTGLLIGLKTEQDDDQTNGFAVFVMEFEDDDAAEDFFDDFSESFSSQLDGYEMYSEMGYGDFELDSDDEQFLVASDLEMYGESLSVRVGCWLDDNTVIALVAIGYNGDADDYMDYADDFCDAADLESPSSLL